MNTANKLTTSFFMLSTDLWAVLSTDPDIPTYLQIRQVSALKCRPPYRIVKLVSCSSGFIAEVACYTTGRPVRRNSTCCKDPLNFPSFHLNFLSFTHPNGGLRGQRTCPTLDPSQVETSVVGSRQGSYAAPLAASGNQSFFGNPLLIFVNVRRAGNSHA